MKEISQFIPELSSVCKIYSGVISGSGIACEDALTLVAFINSFPSVHDLESGIMDLVLKAPAERMEIVLKSLHADLDKIVTLYTDNSIYYDRKDLRFLWDKPLSYADLFPQASTLPIFSVKRYTFLQNCFYCVC